MSVTSSCQSLSSQELHLPFVTPGSLLNLGSDSLTALFLLVVIVLKAEYLRLQDRWDMMAAISAGKLPNVII